MSDVSASLLTIDANLIPHMHTALWDSLQKAFQALQAASV